MIVISNIVTAFADKTIGTKVIHPNAFMLAIEHAVRSYVFPTDGKGFIPLPAVNTVSCGVGIRAGLREEDYIVRIHRGEASLFAKREYASVAESLNVVVYTAKAYCTDPQVDAAEAERVQKEGGEYVIVAVLASVGPKPPLSSHRFVRNLAGGNTSFSVEQGYTLEKAIEDAKAIVAYEKDWVTVAD